MKKSRGFPGYAAALVPAVLFCAGCVTRALPTGGMAPVEIPYTAEAIWREIDVSWRGLGYRSRPEKYAAITFDDGPAGPETTRLLQILRAKHVTATFFLIGENVRRFPNIARMIFEAGHEIGSHSWDGDTLENNAGEETIRRKLKRASEEILGGAGTNPVLFRAPNLVYGSTLKQICAESGMALIGIDVTGWDYQPGISTRQISDNVLSNTGDGDIIGLHESNTAPNTVAALPDMIDRLRLKGFWIMSVGQLAAVKGASLIAGVRYDRIN
jgi:peptidoglycan/xylan/chitin deacetylase (PgdA/CDA1 family)